jgi:hypothetical protein
VEQELIKGNNMEDKLTELLMTCGVTWNPRWLAKTLIEAGVTVDPNNKHCYQCKHFMGCSDWGLCCDLKYGLCYKSTKACDYFEEKLNND